MMRPLRLRVMLLLVAFPIGYTKTGQLKPFRIGRFVFVLAVTAAAGAALWGYLPQESRERMATLLDLKNDYNAGDSTASRSAIWLRNSGAVLSRPIGYGLGTSEYVDSLTGGAYRALHKRHLRALHGSFKVALDSLVHAVTRRTEPRIKLH